ncbi:MAG: hypothetical protein ACI4EK_02945 [Wujia sp.]
MLFLCMAVQCLCVILAILARFHFSKYKDNPLWKRLRHERWFQSMKLEIRKTQVVSEEVLEYLARQRLFKVIKICIGILFVATLFTQLEVLRNRYVQKKTQTIERADYDGNSYTKVLSLTVDDKNYEIPIEIAPLEYTKEQFEQEAQKLLMQMPEKILGENRDLDHVVSDLNLMESDERSVFSYEWTSDHPEILASSGTLCVEELQTATNVCLSCTISYLDYQYTKDYSVTILEHRKSLVEEVKSVLQKWEASTRQTKELTIPQMQEEQNVIIQNHQEEPTQLWLILGGTAILLVVPICRIKRKEELFVRNHTLLCQYPFFVNRMWLMLGAGMTVKMALCNLVSGWKQETILKKEVEYALHQLEVGCEETWVYEQLGRRLGLPEYQQLMQQFSQHIRVGNKQLRNLMEAEVTAALKKRSEQIKQKGEQASTKLLFPMMILLAMVMFMVLYPAMCGM